MLLLGDGARLGERIGRILNTHLTTGSGSSQPNGLVTGATSGVTAASGTAVTYGELIDLKHSVDPAYRGNATWMFSDATLAALKKLVDGDSRPLWNPGIANGEPDRLDGDRYVVNNDVLDMASSAKAIIYGDLSKYVIRDVAGMTLLRLNERYADVGQVGFIAFSRHDGDSLDATAFKCITMA